MEIIVFIIDLCLQRWAKHGIFVLVTCLYALESVEPIFLVEDDRVLKEHGGLSEVLDGDENVDGRGDAICLQADVLLAVRPQQVRSQQGESAKLNTQTGPMVLLTMMSKVI